MLIYIHVYIHIHLHIHIRSTQSMIYVHLLANRFHKSILLITQYKYWKSCSEDFILQDLILSARLCGTGLVSQHCRVVDFHLVNMMSRGCFVAVRYQLPMGTSVGVALQYFYMTHILVGSGGSGVRMQGGWWCQRWVTWSNARSRQRRFKMISGGCAPATRNQHARRIVRLKVWCNVYPGLEVAQNDGGGLVLKTKMCQMIVLSSPCLAHQALRL